MSEDKLEKLKERERVLKEQIKREQAKINARNRKARTKRLIEIGAMVEKYSECKIENFETFEEYLKNYGYAIKRTQEKKGTYQNKL